MPVLDIRASVLGLCVLLLLDSLIPQIAKTEGKNSLATFPPRESDTFSKTLFISFVQVGEIFSEKSCNLQHTRETFCKFFNHEFLDSGI